MVKSRVTSITSTAFIFSFFLLIQLTAAENTRHIDNKFNFKLLIDNSSMKIQPAGKLNNNHFTLRYNENFYLYINCRIAGVNGELKFKNYVNSKSGKLAKKNNKIDEPSGKPVNLNGFKGLCFRSLGSEFPETESIIYFLTLNGIHYTLEFTGLTGKSAQLQKVVEQTVKTFKPVMADKKFYDPDKPQPFDTETHPTGFYKKNTRTKMDALGA